MAHPESPPRPVSPTGQATLAILDSKVRTTNASVHVVNLAGESVWREPFDHCFRIEERPIDPLRRSPEDTMKADGAGHNWFSFRCLMPAIPLCNRTDRLDFGTHLTPDIALKLQGLRFFPP